MFSKLPVRRVARLPFTSVRHLGGLTPLEKFERLRKLCCTSDVAHKRDVELQRVRPRTPESDICANQKCAGMLEELLDIRCKKGMVIGGASGIGLETADCLLKGGMATVVIADVNQCAGLEAVKKLCAKYGNDRATFMVINVAEQASIEMGFKLLYQRYNQIEVLVNSVGIYNETPQCWDKMIRINLLGCVRSTLLGIKYMSKNTCDECNQGSAIVNVSSYGSLGTVPSMPLFSAASNGINGLTSSFGHHFHFCRSKVRCVTLCPSCTDTNLLKNMSRLHYDSQWAGASNAAMRCCTKQSPKIVGKAVVNALRFGENGSVYVIKDGKYYKYDMPDYEKIMRQESVLL